MSEIETNQEINNSHYRLFESIGNQIRNDVDARKFGDRPDIYGEINGWKFHAIFPMNAKHADVRLVSCEDIRTNERFDFVLRDDLADFRSYQEFIESSEKKTEVSKYLPRVYAVDIENRWVAMEMLYTDTRVHLDLDIEDEGNLQFVKDYAESSAEMILEISQADAIINDVNLRFGHNAFYDSQSKELRFVEIVNLAQSHLENVEQTLALNVFDRIRGMHGDTTTRQIFTYYLLKSLNSKIDLSTLGCPTHLHTRTYLLINNHDNFFNLQGIDKIDYEDKFNSTLKENNTYFGRLDPNLLNVFSLPEQIQLESFFEYLNKKPESEHNSRPELVFSPIYKT